MNPFRPVQPSQLEALRKIAALTCSASGAMEVEICTRAGGVTRTFVREGNVPEDVAVHRREATSALPIGSEVVVAASFQERPSRDAVRSLEQAVVSAVAVLAHSAMVQPGRDADSPFALFDTAPMPMFIYDVATSRILDVNAFAVARYGYSREEFLDMTAADLRPVGDSAAPDERRALPRGFSAWQYQRHCWKNGQVRDVGTVSHEVIYQGRTARLVMVDDVTEQRRVERTKDLLLAAAENIDELVVLLQQPRHGQRLPRITFVNAAFDRIFGWSRGALLTGEVLRELARGPNADAIRQLVDAMSTDRAQQLELVVRDRHGEEHTLESAIVPVRAASENGDVALWVAIGRDITQRRAMEARSMQAQRLEAMGLLAGGIAHDFNNLAMAIGGFTQLALKQLPRESQAAEDLVQIQAAADRATALAQRLLAFSRRQEITPQQLEVCALLAELQPMLRRLAGSAIHLSVHCAPVDLAIEADRTQIEQVLLNLVVNARDAQPDGGRIDVRVGAATTSELRSLFPSLADESRAWVRFTVTDAGPGIPPEVRARAFEPFFTTRHAGTGLGLSTVHGIVTQNHGQVTIADADGHGARIEVILPRVAP